MLDQVKSYGPTDLGFRRFYRLHLMVDVPREEVAKQVVAAVQHNRRHVRIPKRAYAFSLLAEAPRRMAEVILTGVAGREKA